MNYFFLFILNIKLDKKIELKRKREEEKNELESMNSNKLFDDNEFFKKINSIKVITKIFSRKFLFIIDKMEKRFEFFI